MRIEVKEKPCKMVLFYLNHKEAADQKLRQSLKENARIWKEQSFLSVVVESGADDLEDSLYCLMKQNRKAVAEKLSA
ncbi:MAG: hypothetical protein J1E85_04955 [Ruminococcus sp.]|nr:hypothetical protein [Ruminococcus sp.]